MLIEHIINVNFTAEICFNILFPNCMSKGYIFVNFYIRLCYFLTYSSCELIHINTNLSEPFGTREIC